MAIKFTSQCLFLIIGLLFLNLSILIYIIAKIEHKCVCDDDLCPDWQQYTTQSNSSSYIICGPDYCNCHAWIAPNYLFLSIIQVIIISILSLSLFCVCCLFVCDDSRHNNSEYHNNNNQPGDSIQLVAVTI